MPYVNIHWVKLKLELLNDKRFLFDLDSDQKLLFIGLLLLAGATKNNIPEDGSYLKNRLNLSDTPEKVSKNLEKILSIFPKTNVVRGHVKFNNFNKLHNPIRDSQGNAEGTPKDSIEKSRVDKIRVEYISSYRQKTNQVYSWNYGKDSKLLKTLIIALGDEEVVKRIKLFFDSNDTFIKSAGYDFGIFYSQRNKLVSDKKNETDTL